MQLFRFWIHGLNQDSISSLRVNVLSVRESEGDCDVMMELKLKVDALAFC